MVFLIAKNSDIFHTSFIFVLWINIKLLGNHHHHNKEISFCSLHRYDYMGIRFSVWLNMVLFFTMWIFLKGLFFLAI